MGKTDDEAEALILWPPDAKNWLTGKNPDPGKDWRQEEKGMTEDEMVGRHHRLNGHEFEQALGVGDGQGSLVCCTPWGRRVSDSEQLNWACHPLGLPVPQLKYLPCLSTSSLRSIGLSCGEQSLDWVTVWEEETGITPGRWDHVSEGILQEWRSKSSGK